MVIYRSIVNSAEAPQNRYSLWLFNGKLMYYNGKWIPVGDDSAVIKPLKEKLDTIEKNANHYVLPTATATDLGGVKVDPESTDLKIEGGVIKLTNKYKTEVTDAIAQVKSDILHGAPETLDTLKEIAQSLGDNTDIAGSITASLALKVDKTTTVSGHPLSGNVTISKADVGLSNVENTADIDKPISTATQTALDGKINKGDLKTINGNSLEGSGNITISQFSGSYNDLTDKPTIPAAQQQVDWNATEGITAIKNKPSDLATNKELADGLNGKVDKEKGKGLSSNDYTTDEKNKLAGLSNYILTGATKEAIGGVKAADTVQLLASDTNAIASVVVAVNNIIQRLRDAGVFIS